MKRWFDTCSPTYSHQRIVVLPPPTRHAGGGGGGGGGEMHMRENTVDRLLVVSAFVAISRVSGNQLQKGIDRMV